MTAAQDLFFRVLSDFLRGETTGAVPPEVNSQELAGLAREHGLMGLFYSQLRDALPAGSHLRQKLYSGFCSDVFFSVNRQEALDQVAQAFSQGGIRFLPFKGTVVSHYYPEPRLRTMGDLDLLIHPHDREKSHVIMLDLGFDSMVDNHAVWTYHRDVAIFEIHDHMMYDPLANELDYQTFFDRAWDYAAGDGTMEILKPEFHFLYLIAHSAKHIINKGYGIRGFLDLVLFVRGEPDMDWEWIAEKLRELRLLDFTKTCFALCRRWFGVALPLEAPEVDDSFYRSATEKLFRDGLWGFSNEENVVGVSARTIRRSRAPYFVTSCVMTVRKLFPSYRNMQLIPWYAFVDGRPWLLPVAWLYRFGYCVVHKASHSSRLLREPFSKTKEIREREQLIDSWGL